MVLENLTIGLQNMVLLEESALRVQGWKEGDTQIHDVSMRTLFVRHVWTETGRLSAVPEASNEETKAERLKRYSELRWSSDASLVL